MDHRAWRDSVEAALLWANDTGQSGLDGSG